MWPNFLSLLGDAFDAFRSPAVSEQHVQHEIPVIREEFVESNLLDGHREIFDDPRDLNADLGIVRDYAPTQFELPPIELDDGLGGGTEPTFSESAH